MYIIVLRITLKEQLCESYSKERLIPRAFSSNTAVEAGIASHLWLHLTHRSAVKRSTGTSACSCCGLLLHSALKQAVFLGWKGRHRLGKQPGRAEGGAQQEMCCTQWPPRQLLIILWSFLELPWLTLNCWHSVVKIVICRIIYNHGHRWT